MNLAVVTMMLIGGAAPLLSMGSGVDDGRWLQQLYNATSGGVCTAGWNMTTGANPCSGHFGWSGVTCNSNGRVTGVLLSSCDLRGTLPEFNYTNGAMSQLQTVELQNNQLNGTLPSSWSALPSLQYMDLHENRFGGSLPPSWSNLHSMVSLSVALNFLSGDLPSSWSGDGSQSNLSKVDVSYNCLSLSSAQSNVSQWNWWLSKSAGTGVSFQRASCSALCGEGQLLTMNGYGCNDCPAGNYCPNPTTTVPCPAGTYNPLSGSVSIAACLLCPTETTSSQVGQNSSLTCKNIFTVVDLMNRLLDSWSRSGLDIWLRRSMSAVGSVGLLIALVTGDGIAGCVLQRTLLQLRLSEPPIHSRDWRTAAAAVRLPGLHATPFLCCCNPR